MNAMRPSYVGDRFSSVILVSYQPKLPVPPNQRRSRRSNALSDDLDMDGLDDSPIPVCKYLCKVGR